MNSHIHTLAQIHSRHKNHTHTGTQNSQGHAIKMTTSSFINNAPPRTPHTEHPHFHRFHPLRWPTHFNNISGLFHFLMQKKWDQPSSSSGPPGTQDPKKTCNLETYLDWSARLRLFVCNEILQVRRIS